MNYKILVIDDEFDRREEGYVRLAKMLSELDGSFKIEIELLKHPNQLNLVLQKNYFSGAIVDAILDIGWQDFNITKALNILGRNIPIAIISERWDQTNAEQIDEALKRPNCRTFLHWRDIDPEGNGQIDYAIRAVQNMIADNEVLNTQSKINPDDPIRILHISDVQTGGVGSENLRLEANRCADSILEHWSDCSPTFVAFTGDVAEHGSPLQYNLAREWIGYFFDRLGLNGLPASNLLYVPGNHDVNLNLAAGARVNMVRSLEGQIELGLAGDIKHPELLGFAYTPFRNFLREICDCPLLSTDIGDHDLAWIESRYRHLGIIFYGINTAQPVNAFGLPDRKVNANALAKLGQKLATIGIHDDFPPLVVGLGHHCPVSASGDNAVRNPEVFDKFFRGRVKTALFLHGHAHEHNLSYMSNDGLRIVRSCAATLTKSESARPSDSLRGFNLLNLERKNNIVKTLTAFSYAWIGNEIKEIQNGKWIRQVDGMFREE